MSNPIFDMMNQNSYSGGLNNIIQQFEQFRKSFTGNPQQQVQQLLNSGKITQQQYNKAVQMANQLQRYIK